MPYDRFVLHQVAGDLVPAPNGGPVHADGIVATTLLSLGPWGGIDRKKRLADIVDDQIDTVGRAFLGLTLACARCHDHKFDPISTADYYGLAGIFFSSHVVPEAGYLSHGTGRLRVPLVPAADVAARRAHQEKVRALEDRLEAAIDRRYAEFARSLLPRVADDLLAAYDYEHRPADQAGVSAEDFAAKRGLQGFALQPWIDYLNGPRLAEARPLDRPVHEFDGEAGVEAWQASAERPWWAVNTTGHDIGIETFLLPPRSISVNPGTEGGAVGWRSPIDGTVRIAGRLTDGDPFDGAGVAWAIDLVSNGSRRELSSGVVPNGGSRRLDQGRDADRLVSVRVRDGDRIELAVALKEGDAHYDITNVDLTITRLDAPAEWDLALDVADDFLASNPHRDSLGHEAVWHFDDLAGSHRLRRMPSVDPALSRWTATAAEVAAGKRDRCALEEAAREFAREVAEGGPGGPLAQDLVGPRSPFHVRARDDAKYLSADAKAALETLAAEVEALRGQSPPMPCAHGIQEGGLRYSAHPGFGDAPIYVRGNPGRLGPKVPRHVPKALAGDAQAPITSGSGRLELARWLASADNPLTARVLVNRLWQHHFGEGLVRTPSNFGRMGEPPSHPELLDWLALRFVESGWSIKAMHRRIMLSAAYQRSSHPTRKLLAADPENRLVGRMNRRRLEAEELRDGLLFVAGRLEQGRGGPADSDASSPRRLIFLPASRGDRSDFGSLFDRANPSLQVDRRTVSTAAPQALYLMNNPFVLEQARRLVSRREVTATSDPDGRIDRLYRLLFGRSPTTAEQAAGRAFIDAATSGPAPDAPGPWERYAQALLLSNEFLFVD
jgi:hypothetical protein